MNFEERLAKTQAKMEELKARINESLDASKADREGKRSETLDKINAFVSDPDAFNKMFNKVDEKLAVMIDNGIDKAGDAVDGLDGKIDEAIKDGAEKYDEDANKLQAKVDDALETTEGDYYAAQENVRIAQDEYKAKLNSTRIEMQMRLEEAKAKIEEKKESVDKAVQEDLIADLLDYADDCQALAYSYTMEAELAIMDACDLIDEYEAKYGKME